MSFLNFPQIPAKGKKISAQDIKGQNHQSKGEKTFAKENEERESIVKAKAGAAKRRSKNGYAHRGGRGCVAAKALQYESAGREWAALERRGKEKNWRNQREKGMGLGIYEKEKRSFYSVP